MQRMAPGTVISVKVGLVWHVGIVTERRIDGYPTVISNSQKVGHVAEETLPEFAGAGLVRVLGYLGNLEPSIVLRRARSQLGRGWSLVYSNCEHFVRWAHGLRPVSPQLRAGLAIGSFVLLIAALLIRG